MTGAEFLRDPATLRALERAAKAAGVPLSVHVHRTGEEGTRLTGHGRCLACRYIAGVHGGKAACRGSRAAAAAACLRRNAPVPFLCHVGFACLCVPLKFDESAPFVATFGPYCPSEEPRALEEAFMEGLGHLVELPEDADLPVALVDVRVVPVTTVPTVAEWMLEVLCTGWSQAGAPEPPPENAEATEAGPARRRREATCFPGDPYGASAMAAVLAGGKKAAVRASLQAVLREAHAGTRPAVSIRRLRTLGAVAAVLEAAQKGGLDTASCLERFGGLVEAVRASRTDGELLDAAMRVLSGLAGRATRQLPAETGYPELNRLVLERLAEGITLNEVSASLEQHPTAITHRLQRRFGLSFSDYVGRLRVDRAKELLRRTRLSVAEVGRRVGVNDASNFGKLFRKFESMSPAKYRERYSAARTSSGRATRTGKRRARIGSPEDESGR